MSKEIEEMAEMEKDIEEVWATGNIEIVVDVLYEAGYRKIPEGAVVLTAERNAIITDRFSQLEKVQAELQELNAKYYNEAKDLRRKLKEARKETASEILQEFRNKIVVGDGNGKGYIIVWVDELNELANQYGFEVEK